jgi:hypothetical protein
MPADPISAKQAEMVRHHGSADLSERADQHLERELLQSENDRLRRENTTLRSAMKAASRIVAPYADDGARRR